MDSLYRYIAVLCILISLVLMPLSLQAREALHIVVDVWPPYVMQKGDELVGSDVEITRAVFAQMNVPIFIELLPWKRCLSLVENKQADAILDASITTEREQFLYFPDEPTSEGVTVFFKRKTHFIPFTGLSDLEKIRVGAISGYSYCDEIDRSPYYEEFERVGTLDQNFHKLLLGRIDTLLEVDSVGYYTAESMGIMDQIDIIPNANYCQSGSYLAFSKKPGHQELAAEFGKVLRQFKTTDAYRQILKKYGSQLSE